jgi:phytoene dehydrogenase-like protein
MSNRGRTLGGHTTLPSLRAEAARARGGTIETGHDLEKIVVGNEPAVSGGFGSQVITHNDDDAM